MNKTNAICTSPPRQILIKTPTYLSRSTKEKVNWRGEKQENDNSRKAAALFHFHILILK